MQYVICKGRVPLDRLGLNLCLLIGKLPPYTMYFQDGFFFIISMN